MRRLKGFFGDLSTGRGRLKLAIVLLGILIVAGAAGGGAISATSTPKFCSTCHEMQPEYATWQVSSHNQASCIQCHVEPGLMPLIKDKLNAMVQVYEHATGTAPIPIVMPAGRIPNESCERCHKVEDIKPKGDLIIPHTTHVEQGVQCVSCHAGVVHGQIAERAVTKQIEDKTWTEEVAKKQLEPKFIRPGMETCTTCHTERKVKNNCGTCHKNALSMAPPTHREAVWAAGHGPAAREAGVQTCISCHPAQKEVKLSSGDAAAALSRGSQFCSQCHQQRPVSHDNQWMLTHKQGVAAKGLSSCLTCHDPVENKALFSPATTFCNRCHSFPQ